MGTGITVLLVSVLSSSHGQFVLLFVMNKTKWVDDLTVSVLTVFLSCVIQFKAILHDRSKIDGRLINVNIRSCFIPHFVSSCEQFMWTVVGLFMSEITGQWDSVACKSNLCAEQSQPKDHCEPHQEVRAHSDWDPARALSLRAQSCFTSPVT